MKKSKFTAWVMAITLLLAPGAVAYAQGTGTTTPTDTTTPTTPPTDTTTPTTPPTDTTTPTTPPTDTPTPPTGGDGPVCPQPPSNDDDQEQDDDTQTPPISPSTPAPQMSDHNGWGHGNVKKPDVKDVMDKFKDYFKNHDNHNNHDDGDKNDNHHGDSKSDGNTCYKHDNGNHNGWSNKIENMVKRLEQLKKEAENLQKQLDQLKEWAKSNGSTSDSDALKQILEAIGAKDQAGQADTNDLLVLAETQDQLNDTHSSVQTLEKALTTNYTDDKVYKLLGQKLVKKGEKGIKVYVKGKKPQFDVQPVVIAGRTLVPLRAIGDALEADVQWDPATQTITLTNKDGKVIKLQIDNNQATVDGKTVTLDVPATVVSDRTLVPLRALGDFFNLQVGWDSDAEMAILK